MDSYLTICVFDHMFFSVYWNYAMTIPLEEIVYLHCHQQGGFTTFSLKTTIIDKTIINAWVLFLSVLVVVTVCN